MKNKSFDFKGFSELDDSDNADFLINSMEESSKDKIVNSVKNEAISLMDIKEGENILEAGCALGYDAVKISEKLGHTGMVYAIDNSKQMINKALLLNNRNNIKYLCHDVNHMDIFDDNFFDSCHVDRLLLSQRNYTHTFIELKRVLKPGGKLVLTDLDFGTIVLYPYDKIITKKLIEEWQTLVENPFIGRELISIFQDFNFKSIQLSLNVYHSYDYIFLNKLIQMPHVLESMAQKQIINSIEAEKLNQLMRSYSRLGKFFYSINFFTVLGIKSTE